MLAKISLIFLLQRMSLFPFPSWRMLSWDNEFWVGNSFLSIPERCCATSFWPLPFMRKSMLWVKLFSPISNISFLSDSFLEYFIEFGFQKFDADIRRLIFMVEWSWLFRLKMFLELQSLKLEKKRKVEMKLPPITNQLKKHVILS